MAITVGDDGTVRVTDDGIGIADPEVLLAFGESQWPTAITEAEQPSGMGLYALARRRPTIRSRTAGSPGWRIQLAEEHFRGETSAPVHGDDGAPLPHGTEVTLHRTPATDGTPTEEGPAGWHARYEPWIRRAALFYPLPVTLHGKHLQHREYLAHCAWTHEWNGLRFGVGTEGWRQRWDGTINFYGKRIDEGLPQVPALGGRCWTVQADVIGPTDQHLALSGRTRITDDAFLQEMRREAEHAIYLAMAQAGERVDREHQARALELGVLLPTPKRQLIAWRPPRAESAAPASDLRNVGRDAILVADELAPSDAQLLAHAAKRSHLATRLCAEHRELRGYAWYDALERVRGFRIEAETGPETWTRTTGTEPDTPEPDRRPNRITLVLRTERSGSEREIRIPAEVAFWADSHDLRDADEIPVTVSRDATIDRTELRELLEAAFFRPRRRRLLRRTARRVPASGRGSSRRRPRRPKRGSSEPSPPPRPAPLAPRSRRPPGRDPDRHGRRGPRRTGRGIHIRRVTVTARRNRRKNAMAARKDSAWEAGIRLLRALVDHLGHEVSRQPSRSAMARTIGELAACGIAVRIASSPNADVLMAAFELSADGRRTAALELAWKNGKPLPGCRWRIPPGTPSTPPLRTGFTREIKRTLRYEETGTIRLPAGQDTPEALQDLEPAVRRIARLDNTGLLTLRRPLRATVDCALHADHAMRLLHRWDGDGAGLPQLMVDLGQCHSTLDLRWCSTNETWEDIDILRLISRGHGEWGLEAQPAVNAMRSERQTVTAAFALERRGSELAVRIDDTGEMCIGYWTVNGWHTASPNAVKERLEAVAGHADARKPEVLRAAAEKDWWNG